MKGGLEGDHDNQEKNHHSNAPRRRPLRRRTAVAPSPVVGGEEEQVGVLHGGEPTDEKDEEYGDSKESPAKLLLGSLNDGLVGGGPWDAGEEEDKDEYEQNWVWKRGEGEGVLNRVSASSVVPHHWQEERASSWGDWLILYKEEIKKTLLYILYILVLAFYIYLCVLGNICPSLDLYQTDWRWNLLLSQSTCALMYRLCLDVEDNGRVWNGKI